MRETVELSNEFGVVALASLVRPTGLVEVTWDPTQTDVAKTFEKAREEMAAQEEF
jgi:hypothetical protein